MASLWAAAVKGLPARKSIQYMATEPAWPVTGLKTKSTKAGRRHVEVGNERWWKCGWVRLSVAL